MSNNEGFVDIMVEDMRLDDPELKSYDGKQGAKIPPGTYEFEVIGVERKPSKAGNPMLVVEYKVTSPGDQEGDKIKQFVTLNPALEVSRARLKCLIEALNVPLLEGGVFNTGAMIGLRMEADVELETEEGKYDPVRNVQVPGKTFSKIVSERPTAVAAQPSSKAAAGAAAPATRGRPVGNANGARQQPR
jgi:hypothetical protein